MQKIIVEQGGVTKELNVENNYSTNGWTAIFANVADGVRVVQKIIDLVGGTGAKPSGVINKYMGASGLVSNIADATNIKGADGSSADDITVNNISPINGNITLTAEDVGADEEGAAAQALTDANSYTDETALVLGETSQTAYRGDMGKTAYDHSQSTGNPHNTGIDDISGLRTALNSAGSLGIGSTAQNMVFFDDFLNVEVTKSYATTTSGVDEIPVATISAAALNWIGGIRTFDATNGGYYRANCPNKTATTLFNFLEQNNTIDFATEVYIPTTAEAPATTGSYFVGIVADHPSNVGLTGAVALVVWDVNSANWRLRLANGTFVDTGITASKGTKFKIDIKQASDTVLVKINGTTVVAERANSISESAVLPCCGFSHAGVTSVTYEIWQDYHGLKLTLNSTRTNFGFS